MLLAIFSSLMFVEKKRRLDEVFPERVMTLEHEWELPVTVLISLALQFSLIHLGNRRKRTAKIWLRFSLWFAYLLADLVATYALGVLSRDQRDSCSIGGRNNNPADDELTAFWAPFLLLHLGGPETITAYAFADNQLWLRHLLALGVHTSMAFYITFMAWKSTWLSFLSIPMLLAGFIKYLERSLAMYSANDEQFPDPSPNYAKFMEEFILKPAEGFHVTVNQVPEHPIEADELSIINESENSLNPSILLRADSLFQTFKHLFLDLIISVPQLDEIQSYLGKVSSITAFNLIEAELGFIFDFFYTKAPITYTLRGFILRSFTFSSTIFVFAYFLLSEKNNKSTHKDLIVTYILLAGAIFLEIYALILLLSSDWMTLWLSKRPRTPLFKLISSVQLPKKPRWSNSVAQFNLLSFCLKERHMGCPGILKHNKMYSKLEKSRYETPCGISANLKGLIFNHFKEKSMNKENKENQDVTSLCTCRGGLVLRKYQCEDLVWSTEVEFGQSILIWHIATDICYHLDKVEDHDINSSDHDINSSDFYESKHISDYMLYLLVMCPFMLSIGIGMIGFRDTCAEAMEIFEERRPSSNDHKTEACNVLLEVNINNVRSKMRAGSSNSVLSHACWLTVSLRKLGREIKWEVVSNVWVEILGYAAIHCSGNSHAQQLRRGGELLTHVWLLMAHFGISERIQKPITYAIDDLIVE